MYVVSMAIQKAQWSEDSSQTARKQRYVFERSGSSKYFIQSTLVISASFIPNNRLSRTENLVPRNIETKQ